MPSVSGAVKDTGAIDFQLEEQETTEVVPDSMGGHDDSSHSPQIVTDPSDPCITDFVVSPLVVHYRSPQISLKGKTLGMRPRLA